MERLDKSCLQFTQTYVLEQEMTVGGHLVPGLTFFPGSYGGIGEIPHGWLLPIWALDILEVLQMTSTSLY